MKKAVSVFLTLCLLCGMSTLSYAEESMFAGGSGTEEDPYQIATLEQMLSFAESVNDGSAEVVEDILPEGYKDFAGFVVSPAMAEQLLSESISSKKLVGLQAFLMFNSVLGVLLALSPLLLRASRGGK